MDIIVLILGSRSSGGSLDRRGSDERRQHSEGDSDELHGSVLAGTVVVVVCDIESVEGLMVERGGGGRWWKEEEKGGLISMEQGDRAAAGVCYPARQKLLSGDTHLALLRVRIAERECSLGAQVGQWTGEIGEIVKVERAKCSQSVLCTHRSNHRTDERVKKPNENMTGRYVRVEALGILKSKDNALDDIPSSSVYVYTIEHRNTIKTHHLSTE